MGRAGQARQDRGGNRMIFVRDIQAATAEHFGVPLATMTVPDGVGTRVDKQTRPRQVAMCLSMRLTEQGSARIGRLFARDHSTICHAMRVTEQRRRIDPEIAEALRSVTRKILAEAG